MIKVTIRRMLVTNDSCHECFWRSILLRECSISDGFWDLWQCTCCACDVCCVDKITYSISECCLQIYLGALCFGTNSCWRTNVNILLSHVSLIIHYVLHFIYPWVGSPYSEVIINSLWLCMSYIIVIVIYVLYSFIHRRPNLTLLCTKVVNFPSVLLCLRTYYGGFVHAYMNDVWVELV
jgi:hypothetical protein